jgi:hypothetical protein
MSRCCHDHRMLWWKKRCYPALPCKLAVVIHRMLWCKEGCAIPALPCKLAVAMIHRMLWWKKVCYPCAAVLAAVDSQNALKRCAICAVMHASCCHDPQNALEEGCAIPRCHACKLLS